MVPLFSDWITPLESAVDDLFTSLEDGIQLQPEVMISIGISDEEIEEAWLEIALALLREARESYNLERWNAFRGKIDKIVASHPKFSDRYYYERALWMMWNIERSQAKRSARSLVAFVRLATRTDVEGRAPGRTR